MFDGSRSWLGHHEVMADSEAGTNETDIDMSERSEATA